MTETPNLQQNGEDEAVENGGSDLPERRGVGPWDGPRPSGDYWDQELLEKGDYRNVEDQYRYWKRESIAKDIASHSLGYEVAVENLGHDFNIGSIVRSANALGASRVHIVGRRRWNRRGAMVTDRYMDVVHEPNVSNFVEDTRARGFSVIGIDNLPGSTPLEEAEFPEKSVLVFGEEGGGLSDEMLASCDQVLHITQYGSTRSLNVGHAAAIAMWAWVVRNSPGQKK